MKKLLLSFVGIFSSLVAIAATTTDIVAISQNYTLIADDVTSNGTVVIGGNVLFGDDHFLSDAQGLSVATNKGSSTIGSTSHLNSLRIKNNVKIAFKVSKACHVKVYHQSNSTRTVIISKEYKLSEGDVIGKYSTTTTEADIAGEQIVYIYSIDSSNTTTSGKGDLYIAAIEITFEPDEISTETPTFSTDLETSYSATVGKTLKLTVESDEATSYQWYICDDAEKTNASAIDAATSSSYNYVASSAGDAYIYCVATNDNASGEKNASSNVAKITASAPTTSIVTWKNTNGWTMRSVKNGSSNVSSGNEVDNGSELEFTTDLGAGYIHEWYVNGVKKTATGGTGNTNTTLKITINEDTEVESRYNPLYKFTFTDNSKAKAYANAEGKITLSTNNFSYSEGKSVDYWTNGSNKYYVGTEYTLTNDVDLTPHFADNTVALGDAQSTVTWTFGYKADNTGCPVFTSLQGASNKIMYPAKATINEVGIDVNMNIDVTSGKADNERRLDYDNTQLNKGTILTIPAIKGMTIEYTANGALKVSNKTATTIAGTSDYVLSNNNKTATYIYEGDEPTIDIVIGDDNTYGTKLAVTYPLIQKGPSEPSAPIVSGSGFSMEPTAALNVAKNNNVELTSSNADIDGGRVKFYVTGTSDRDCVTNTTPNRFQLNKDSYYEVTLSNALQAGDVLQITTYGSGTSRGFAIRSGSSSTTTGQVAITGTKNGTDTQSYTVAADDAFVGKTVLYIVTTESSNTAYFTKFEVVSTSGAEKLTLTTTANMAGYRSFCGSKSYTLDANTKAYVASEAEGADIVLKQINGVPANTPVILVTTNKLSDDTYSMTLTEGDVDAYEGKNLLQATTEGQNIGKVYRLGYKASNGVGFYTYTSSSAPAGIVYLNEISSENESKGIHFLFEDGIATGINNITNVIASDTMIFSISGARLNKLQKGINIVNGKKVMVK